MPDTNAQKQPNSNPLILPLIGFLYVFSDIFYCAFKGVKFIFIDLFLLIYNATSGQVDNAYQSTKVIVENGAQARLRKLEEQKQKKEQLIEKYNNLWFVKQQYAKLEEMREVFLKTLQTEGSIRSHQPRVFQYKAKNKKGIFETGTINGYSKLDVNTFLLQEGYTVYDIQTNQLIDFLYGDTSIFAIKMSNKDLLFWLTQLSTYIKSGIPLTEAVKILNNQLKNKKHYRKALQSIVYELTMGESFSKALEKQGSMFPSMLINMLKAAEATGELESTLEDMALYYSDLEKTRKEMISAMTYPTIIFIFAIGVVSFILLYVIPEFVKIYKNSNITISGLTLFIINFSVFLKDNIMSVILFFILICIAIYLCYKNIKAFRRQIQYFLMHIPFIGNIFIYNELTIFSKTFASLLSNNVFITDSMTILSRITNNEIYKEIMTDTIDFIVKGDKISTAFKDHWAVPDVAYYMIVTGESTGQLADMMRKVGEYYADMHQSLVASLKSFVEPVMIAFLAIVVGGIILAVLIPMFGLLQSMR